MTPVFNIIQNGKPNRSEIMKRVWYLVKQGGMKFQSALKKTWDKVSSDIMALSIAYMPERNINQTLAQVYNKMSPEAYEKWRRMSV